MLLQDIVLATLDPVTHQTYITTGGAIIICILTVGLPLVIGQNVVNGRRTKRTAAQAARAVEQTAKTGNGYALRTEQALARIEQGLHRLEGRVDTLTDRFNNHTDKEATK